MTEHPGQAERLCSVVLRQPLRIGDHWADFSVSAVGSKKRISVDGCVSSEVELSSFLAATSDGERIYLYDYGSDSLYGCSVSEDLGACTLLRRVGDATIGAAQLKTELLCEKVFYADMLAKTDQTYLTRPRTAPTRSVTERQYNLDSFQPYEPLKSRQQRAKFEKSSIVSATSVALANTLSVFLVTKRMKVFHSKNIFGSPKTHSVYENWLLKVDLHTLASTRQKLPSQHERAYGAVCFADKIYFVAEGRQFTQRSQDTLDRFAENLEKRVRSARLDEEDTRPVYEPLPAPYVATYTICLLDPEELSVSERVSSCYFLRLLVSDAENIVYALNPSVDLSGILQGFKLSSESLEKVRIPLSIAIDKVFLECAYVDGVSLASLVSKYRFRLAENRLEIVATPPPYRLGHYPLRRSM